MLIRYINGHILFPLLAKYTGRHILGKYKELKRHDLLTGEEKAALSRQRLIELLEYCRSKVPFYRDEPAYQAFDISKLSKDARYIEELPLLTKDIIRDNVDRLRSAAAIHPRKTGGSTGESVFFYYDDTGLDWTAAINLHAYDMARNYTHKKDCHISSELGLEPTYWRDKLQDWVKLFAQNRKRLMISAFTDDVLAVNVSELRSMRPYLLQGHPSSAYAMADYIERAGHKRGGYCKVFEPSGEMLTDKMVESIERNLGAKVVNRYGNAEFGVMAHSRFDDRYNRLQVFDRAFYMEDCDASNLVVTNYTNLGMPLIRYDTGDIGTVVQEQDGTFLYDIQGRIHDNVVISGESFATHFIMDFLDHKVRNIREFQIVLGQSANPVLNIIPEDPADKQRIESEVKARWPVGLDVGFIGQDELVRTGWRQKFRHLVDLQQQETLR